VIRHCLIIALFGMVASCDQPQQDGGCLELKSLPGRNGEADAKLSFRKGDKRVLMMGGLVGETPGAGNYRGGYRVLEGTSDMTTQACRGLRKEATPYVDLYNREMVAMITGNGS
jgi:hypothetical protein